MFDDLLSGDRPDPTLVEQLVEELTVHAKVEEQVVYPTARDDEAEKLMAQIKRKKGQETALRQLLRTASG